jgi:hypothetical protein
LTIARRGVHVNMIQLLKGCVTPLPRLFGNQVGRTWDKDRRFHVQIASSLVI